MASNINYIFQYTSNILKPNIENINQNIKSNLHLNNISGSLCNLLNISLNNNKILINTSNITTTDINISSLSNLNNLSEPIITSFNNSSNMIDDSSNFIVNSINSINTSLNSKYNTIDINSSNYNSNINNDIIKNLNNLNISNIQNGLINKYIENNVIDYNLIIDGNATILNGIISSNTVTSSSKIIANEDLEIISSSTINPALKIQQNNSQNIIEIYGNTNTKFIVNNNGNFGLGINPTTSNSLELLGNLNSTTGLYSNSLPFSYFGLSNIPLTFTPSAHLHTISDINGLTSALNTKQNIITSLTSNYNTLNINSGLNISSGYNFKENNNILKLESSVLTSNYWNEKLITIIDNNTLKELTNITGTDYYYYAFTSTTGKNSITFVNNTICDILVVAGGGGGGQNGGGGGGAGGYLYYTNILLNGFCSITIGNGGVGAIHSPLSASQPGGNSTFVSGSILYTAIGGGGGNGRDVLSANKNGGSGGGGGGTTGTAAGTGTAGPPIQGYNGGNGFDSAASSAGGGGGGAGGVATTGASLKGGDGGIGISNNISGTYLYYSGGGAGADTSGGSIGKAGLGSERYGGGGNGGRASANGLSGLSGIVIIRIKQQTYSSSISYTNTSINANSLILRNYSSNIIINNTISSPISYNITNEFFIYEFTTGSNYVNIPYNTVCDILLVGGGGSGGSKLGSGGNSGNVIYSTNVIIPAGNYNIIIGKGGTYGEDGSDTIAFGATAKGGRGIITKIPSGIKATVSPEPIIGNSSNCYYTFTNNGSITFNKNTICDILIVGGGGSGGIGLGGGSSGGLLYSSNIVIPTGVYPIIVGVGGNNGNGGNSIAFGATAKGGLKATTIIGATNNGINTISGSIITSWDKNLIALAGGTPFYVYTVVRKYPPIGFTTQFASSISNSTGNITSQSYGNGTYTITASSYYGTVCPWSFIFDNNTTGTTFGGADDGPGTYTVNNGSYVIAKNRYIVSDYLGEWIKIQLPPGIEVYLSYIRLFYRINLIERAPRMYKVYGYNTLTSSWDVLINNNTTEATYDANRMYTSPTITPINKYNIFALSVNKIGNGPNGNTLNFDEWELYGQEIISSTPSGGGGVGSVGESSTSQIFKPNGGSGFPISIRISNELFAGGGGANEGLRVPLENIIGYGGNSTSLSAENGGNGIVIIRVPADNTIREDYGSIYRLNDDNIINNNAVILNKFDSARQNLLAWYKFDGDFNDSSGNNYHLTNTNCSISTTQIKIGSGCVAFTDSSYLTYGISNTVFVPATISISLWVYYTSIGFSQIISTQSGANGWLIQIDTNGHLKYFISNSQDFIKISTSYNQWIHIVMILSSSSTTQYIYLNGLLNNTINSCTYTSGIATTLRIGAQVGTAGFYMKPGSFVDDVRIYNKVLSKDEVEYIYSTTNTKSNYLPYATSSAILYNNLRIWYKFSGKLGITDNSINSLNAIATGTPVISNNIINITQPNYLQLPSNIIDFNNDITICFWYRFDNSAGFGRLIDISINTNINNHSNSIKITRQGITSSLMFIIDSLEINVIFGHTTSGEMIHLTWVIKKNGIWNIYKNGVSILSQLCVYPITNIYTYSYLGKSNWTSGTPTYNLISLKDFRIYNRSLIPDEIYNIYNQITTTSLVAYSSAPFISNNNFYNDTSSMLVWYKFDGNLTDSSGNGLTSTTTGTIVYGIDYSNNPNGALAFNGSGYFSTVSGTTNYFFQNYFTVSFWLYTSSTVASNIIEALVSARTSTNSGWNIYISNRKFSLPIATTNDWGAVNFDTYFDSNSWKYCTFLFNMPTTSTLTITLYINSIFRETKPLTGGSGIVVNSVQNLAIGSVGGTFTCQSTTKIDDFRIYNRILTNDEISILYNNDYRNLTYLRKGYNLANFYNDITDMIAWYKFENNYNDSSGNRYNSFTITGTTSFSSIIKKIGSYGGDFNGGYLTNNSINLNGKSFSVCFWIYKRADAQYSVVGQGTVQGLRQSLHIGFRPDNRIMFAFYNDDCNSINAYIDNNTWVHLVYTYDYSTRIRRIYRNNIEIPTTASIAGGDPNFNANTRIGNTVYGGTALNAVIDDLRMYNRTLTPSEIDIIYNQYNIEDPLQSFYNSKNNMIAWYKFDNDYNDSSGNGYHLTNSNCIINTTQQKDDIGCVAFTGLSYLTYEVSNTVFVPATISISLWVYYTAVGQSQIISTQYNTNGWVIYIDTSGHLKYLISSSQGFIKNSTSYNEWIHIVMTLSSSTKYIYLNGILSNTIATGYISGIATTLRIGAQVGPLADYMKVGSFVDDVRIYNCILTPTEINILYNQYTITNKLKTFYNNKNDMIAWYKFENNYYDSSGNGHTLINTISSFDNINKIEGISSILFPSTQNGKVEFPTSIHPYNIWNNSISGISFSIWFRYVTQAGNWGRLLDFQSNIDIDSGIFISVKSAFGGLYFKIQTTTFSYSDFTTTTGKPLDGRWHHIVWNINKSGVWTIYYDGIDLKCNKTCSLTNIATYNVRYIADSAYAGDASFSGNIDDYRIYNRILNPSEIDILYTQKIYDYSLESFNNNATDMIAWYKFDGDFTDSSGNGHTLINTISSFDNINKIGGISSILFPSTENGKVEFPTSIHPYNIWNNSTSGITFSIWFRYVTQYGFYGRLLDFQQNVSLTSGILIVVRGGVDRGLIFQIEGTIFSYSDHGTTTGKPLDGLWHHIVWSIDKSGNWTIYYDGTNLNCAIKVSLTDIATYNIRYIADSAFSSDASFSGNIDDYRIYNRTLTPSEIALLANRFGGGGGSVISSGKITSTSGGTGGDALIIPMMNYESFAKGGDGFSYNSSSTRLGIGYGGIGSTSLTYNSGGNGTVIIKISYHPYIVDADKFDQQPIQIPGTNDFYYAFTSTTGTNSITFRYNILCDILVVGGGGSGGGTLGGGGGAGAVVYIQNANIGIGTYNITIGTGGTSVSGNLIGNKGGTSSFNGILAEGGGAGSYFTENINGGQGGSGGGGGSDLSSTTPNPLGGSIGTNSTLNGFSGSIYQNKGGDGLPRNTGLGGGGGGGANEAGINGNISQNNKGGKGGDGIKINIDGNNYYWGAGGGGSGYDGTAGSGGLGGGGGGAVNAGTVGSGGSGGKNTAGNGSGSVGGNGGANTGSGGGAGGWVSATPIGGAGGSGIVIIRWTIPGANITSEINNGGVYVDAGNISTLTGDITTYSGNVITNNCIVNNNVIINTLGYTDKQWKIYGNNDNQFDLSFDDSANNSLNWTTTAKIKGNGGTAGYVNFTGMHHCKASTPDLYDDKYIGYIVSSTKQYKSINSIYDSSNIQRNIDKNNWDALPIVDLASEKDKKVFGVIAKVEDAYSNSREEVSGNIVNYFEKKSYDRRLHIAGVGEGGIWVCNYNNTIIESGDYITSSPIPGIGMKQDDDLVRSYTVAKATMDCDFNPKKIPVKILTKIDDEYDKDTNGNYIYSDLLDINGNIIYEDEYEIKYISLNGNIVDENEYKSAVNIYKMAFIGCSYNCS